MTTGPYTLILHAAAGSKAAEYPTAAGAVEAARFALSRGCRRVRVLDAEGHTVLDRRRDGRDPDMVETLHAQIRDTIARARRQGCR
jgi:predicted Rdx family selenoprotein